MRFLLLTGMSGAGKTTAIRVMEDMGVPCVDNLPPMLIGKLMPVYAEAGKPLAAFSVDVRSGVLFDAAGVRAAVAEARQAGNEVEVFFLDAADETLVNRYKESRREHPLSGDSVSLTEAIALERSLLQPLRETADYLVDTTALNPKQLQQALECVVRSDEKEVRAPLRVEVMSFGFKRGLPRQADMVFDVRFLPNPFYIRTLCRHSGLDEDVRDFVMQHPVTREFMARASEMLDFLLPNYQNEGKRRLVIAVGCTGGAHRSVAITEAIGEALRQKGYAVTTHHRDLRVEQARWDDVPEHL